MFVSSVTDTINNDFYCIYECEHCHHKQKGYGYNDSYFHDKVIPSKTCPECGKNREGNKEMKDA